MGFALLFNGVYTSLTKASDQDLEMAVQMIEEECDRRRNE
jgi:hypothetical protein